jgi:hypothetical protein
MIELGNVGISLARSCKILFVGPTDLLSRFTLGHMHVTTWDPLPKNVNRHLAE